MNLWIDLSKNIKNDLEISIITESSAKSICYPMPFELHFSKEWKKKYENNKVNLSIKNKDPDLPAHIMIITKYGKKIYGKPINKAFNNVSKEIYKKSIFMMLNNV
jgi:streptomycin 3"-adenylyltransferase